MRPPPGPARQPAPPPGPPPSHLAGCDHADCTKKLEVKTEFTEDEKTELKTLAAEEFHLVRELTNIKSELDPVFDVAQDQSVGQVLPASSSPKTPDDMQVKEEQTTMASTEYFELLEGLGLNKD